VQAGGDSPRPDGLELLWATGPAHHEAVASELAGLGAERWVHAVNYLENMPAALAAADLAVSRAGAMALAELAAWGIPSILVPFPHAAANHQHHNAVALTEAGAARMVPESELKPGRLWSEIVSLATSTRERSRLAARASERGRPDAADRIVAELAKLLDR
jgi:UDP-N-acetylglucosamine--N-acetylmuramyl-(pentapeptide) pyrophosphoryl-undecaprenol N-acetylglucosamine transferase